MESGSFKVAETSTESGEHEGRYALILDRL
jgi:hypothetical protein